jgi:hypothetical protein
VGVLSTGLKQFVVAPVSQATAETKSDLARVGTRLGALEDRLSGVGEQVSDLDRRSTERLGDIGLQLDTIADAHAERLEAREGERFSWKAALLPRSLGRRCRAPRTELSCCRP